MNQPDKRKKNKKPIKENLLEKIKDGENKKPNWLETQLLDLIKQNSLPFIYTGNGSFWIKYANPDFVSTNAKKRAVEMNGCYWHNCPKCYPKKGGFRGNKHRDEYRKELYKKYGWKVITIWGHEVEEENWKEKVLKKLLK